MAHQMRHKERLWRIWRRMVGENAPLCGVCVHMMRRYMRHLAVECAAMCAISIRYGA
jgi:hypothetical protein